jgi:hypothetical protein
MVQSKEPKPHFYLYTLTTKFYFLEKVDFGSVCRRAERAAFFVPHQKVFFVFLKKNIFEILVFHFNF